MGTWGNKPYQGDGAQDLLGEYAWDPLNKALRRMMAKRLSKSGDRTSWLWDRVGVVYQLSMTRTPRRSGRLKFGQERSLFLHLDLDLFSEGLGYLDEIEEDGEWLSGWRNPAEVRREIRAVRKHFEDVLAG